MVQNCFLKSGQARKVFAATAVLLALSVSAFAGKLTLLWSPLFPGLVQTNCYPLKIIVENNGPAAVGELVIQSGGVALHYPVNVPSGGKQAFLAYPLIPDGMHPLQFDLNTDQEEEEFLDRTPIGNIIARNAGIQLLGIADDPSHLGALRYSKDGVKVFYANPKLLPDRGVAYGSVDAVLLGPGAEQMSDAAILGLEQYVLMGGKLFFFGGSEPTCARDPRLQSLCPVKNLHSSILPSATFNTPYYKAQLKEPVFESIGDLVAGANALSTNGPVLMASRPVGAGTVYYLGISPFDDSTFMRHANDGRVQWSSLISNLLLAQSSSTPHSPPLADSTAIGFHPDMVAPESPFSVQLPSIGLIAIILLIYVILVAPINLLILRKARKSEFAWFTAPCVSLAGAGVFFHFASSLYSAPISKMVSACVIADGYTGQAYAVGNAELFFPSGGQHDVGLGDAELIKNGISVNSFRGGMPISTGNDQLIDVFDNHGSLTVPELKTRNLSFRSIAFQQELNDSLPKADLRFKNDTLKGTLWNHTDYTLVDAEIRVKNSLFTLGTIKPGETRHLDEIGHLLDTAPGPKNEYQNERYGDKYGLSADRFLLDASVPDMAVGPQIKTSESNSDVTLFESFGAPH